MIDIPSSILEQIFIYLDWNDRLRASRVCKMWHSVFKSPTLWRSIVFKPPCRRLTKLQYDIKGYRLSCCLRAIGCHIRNYKFLKSDDLFLLNRTLNLVARFLEYSSKIDIPSTKLHNSCDSDADEHFHRPEETSDRSYRSNPNHNVMRETDYGFSGFIIEGDPDAEATLRLIFELQERETQDFASDLSSDDQSDVFEDLEQFNSNRMSSISYPPSRPYDCSSFKRSKSIQYPSSPQNVLTFNCPPVVRSFELDFNSEVDDLRGFIYGTGGALLKTINRVIRQLNKLQRLRLVDLFLVSDDARQLVCEISDVASNCLTDLNLVHFHKSSMNTISVYNAEYVPTYANIVVDERQNVNSNSSNSYSYQRFDEDWYLLDPRWLSSRSQRANDNPLCDISSLFPKIIRLTLSPTQLTGPMLLRLLYQTSLEELSLIQHIPSELNVSCSIKQSNESCEDNRSSYELDHVLSDLVNACPHLNLLALGGSSVCVHILTLLVICRQRNQCTTILLNNEHKCSSLQLLIQKECCQLDGICPLIVPATISTWYSTMITESVSSRLRIAECCICTALGQRRWHFLTNSEFYNQLSNYLL
ncbi:F-box domain isoform 3 [Schistosoma japonicum]|uniref:F-box domain isoform 3 n=1 Tax=Schistosoma japonicum TaxID=6182 RepID=A0A4Z2DR40_SCHJA|nr:F-box domain [Schistosoma japonicum]TNN18902.1 F-box domain isoform 3 [Schistosoma japonicum]